MNNLLKQKCNEARWEHIRNLTRELSENNNPKPFWNFVKSQQKGTNNLVSLKVGDRTLSDDLNIARSMNEYFCTVFTVEDFANWPELDYVVDRKLENIHCDANEVEKYLYSLNPHKSPGPDYIPSRILKTCARELAPSISLLLNKSFATGDIPDEWKSADVSPIFKKGSKHERDSCRQISLTCIICKIGEKIVKDRIINFWNDL